MQRYIARRLLQAIPTFFGITVIVYAIMAASGDPIAILAFDPTMRQDERERLAIRLGISDPLPVQYLRWLIGDDWMMVDTNLDGEADAWGDNYGILRGDFGSSFKFRGSNPLNLIAERLGATIELNVAALLVGYSVAIVLGVLAAVYRGRAIDRYSRIFSVMGDSFPSFWLGLLLIMFFGIALPRALEPHGLGDGGPMLPMGGRCPPVRGGCPPIYERLQYMICSGAGHFIRHHRRFVALAARANAGDDQQRLHPHRPRQGLAQPQRLDQACLAQRFHTIYRLLGAAALWLDWRLRCH